MMGASFLRAASRHALMLLDVTQLTAGIAKPWSCAVSSRSIIAWPVSTPGCTLGGSFGYSPIAQSSVHGKPISSAAVPARAVAGAQRDAGGAKPSAGAIPSASTRARAIPVVSQAQPSGRHTSFQQRGCEGGRCRRLLEHSRPEARSALRALLRPQRSARFSAGAVLCVSANPRARVDDRRSAHSLGHPLPRRATAAPRQRRAVRGGEAPPRRVCEPWRTPMRSLKR